jgi:PAS domain S-box-containing protein
MKKKSRTLLALALFLPSLFLPGTALSAPPSPAPAKRILVLYSHHIGMPWDTLVQSGLTAEFSGSNRNDLDLNIEYLDFSRNPSEDYQNAILHMLEMKYAGKQPDIIISDLDKPGSRLLMSIHRLFPDAWYILSYDQVPSESSSLFPDQVVGFSIEPNFHNTHLDFIEKAMPQTDQICYISGATPTELNYTAKARESFEEYEDRFDFIYLEGLPLDDLLDRVGRLDKNTAILFSTYFRDLAGNAYTPRVVLEQIHERAQVPIFGLVDTFLGSGIVGGRLSSAEQLGRTAAQIALSILDNELPAGTRLKKVPAVNMFDWRELKRWDISEDLLPENSTIRYREFSFFALYKWHFFLGICIVLTQTLLIACLMGALRRRKIAEKALSGSEKKYRRLVENLRDGIISIDRNHIITGFNTGAMRIFGYREDDIIGRPITALMPPDENKQQLEAMTEVLKHDIFSENESTRLKKDGTPIPVRVIQSTLKNESDHIIGLVEIVKDISRQKEAQREKAELEMALQQAQKMEAIGTLAGGVAHDFNNILAAIIGFTEFSLLELPPDSPLEPNLQEVMKAGKRARDLVNQILTFAKNSREAVRPIHVSPIADEALKLLRSTIPASIEIRRQIRAASPILADPVKIHQVFMNICVNAAQSMQNGGILEMAVADVNKDDIPPARCRNLPQEHYLEIRISDTGSGIPPYAIGMIFEPYFTTKEVGSGSGLGLSVVHGIVKSYGGAIFVDSEMGQGTVFTIYFPTTRGEPKEIPMESSGLPGGNEHILVVDDEPAITKMISQLLGRLGYSVTAKTESAAALAVFQSKPDAFDLLITDMTMPVLCGDVLARKIKQIRSEIPIILCTGYSKTLADKKPNGISALLMKPVEQKKLADIVRELLDNKMGRG